MILNSLAGLSGLAPIASQKAIKGWVSSSSSSSSSSRSYAVDRAPFQKNQFVKYRLESNHWVLCIVTAALFNRNAHIYYSVQQLEDARVGFLSKIWGKGKIHRKVEWEDLKSLSRFEEIVAETRMKNGE